MVIVGICQICQICQICLCVVLVIIYHFISSFIFTGASSSSSSSQLPTHLEPSIMYAATFGHDSNLPKFTHEYFGSEVIVNELKAHNYDGYVNHGYLEIATYSYARNARTNLVSHMKVEKV